MPWTEKQIKLARFAKHNPEKVSKKNKSILSMSPEDLSEMAAWKGPIKAKSLPKKGGG